MLTIRMCVFLKEKKPISLVGGGAADVDAYAVDVAVAVCWLLLHN